MKKVLGVAAVAALFATTTMAATVQVRVVTTGNAASAPAGPSVPVFVQAQLDNGGAPTSSGLALIGFNIDVTGSAPDPNLCDTSGFLLMAPTGMANFDRLAHPGPGFSNWGLTNPSASPNLSGYSGTCNGAGKLLQLGGGQNTIGNTPGGAPYPIGAVVTGIANGGWVTIAEGDIDASSLAAGAWTVAVDTVFANTINTGQVVAPYAVTEATIGTLSSLSITAGILCNVADVNCSGSVTGLDLAIVTNGSNWLKAAWPAVGGALCDRANVNGDANVTGLDLAVITNVTNWLTATGPCTCNTSTPGAGGCP